MKEDAQRRDDGPERLNPAPVDPKRPPRAPAKRAKRRRRVVWCASFCVAVAFAVWSCTAAPIPELWPPRLGEPRFPIEVVGWDWHTFIILPREAAGEGRTSLPAEGARSAHDDGPVQEWGFCERAWYLEGKQGIGGLLRALCWPTESGVERLEAPAPYWRRHPERSVERWRFVLSERGMERMRSYLESQRGEPIPGHPAWYSGKSDYHLFFVCHHFTLEALREAGLPVRPWWAFAGWMARIQLDRAARFHLEAGL
jgi:hypothetical protein